MACVGSDGSLSTSAKSMLEAVSKASSASEVATATGLPLFRVRSGLRELAEAGFATEADGLFSLTEQGAAKLA